jgi:glycosyltransferase 2 family protein
MRKKLISALKYILFLCIGVFVFWLVYRDIDMVTLKTALGKINYWWILLSFILGMLSHISRAIRWNMLIRPMGYNPSTLNSFLSVMVMYLTNLALPRAGELARCSVLGRYEQIPFTKLVGTVVIERFTDMIALVIFAVLIFSLQADVFLKFIHNHPDIQNKLILLFSTRNLVILLSVIVLFIIALIVYRKNLMRTSLFKRIEGLYVNFLEGIRAIKYMESKWKYIGHTIFIYIMWLIMLYVVFFSYPPTANLSLPAGMAAFVMGGLAMIAPVQGGIGPWHFMVYETLFIYGIDKTDGKIFALIAHTTTNLSLMFMGFIALLLLPIINRKKAIS